jgi:carbon monoxide dehydrogenase subunit G
MATLHKQIRIAARRDDVWAAVRDLGALHTRLVPGFVVDTRMDGPEARIVTFANGLTAREEIISVDDERHRLAWNATGSKATHYNAVLELFADGEVHTRVVWTSDLLPHALAAAIGEMQDQGLAAMQRALERKG